MSNHNPWVFPLLVGVIVGLVVGRWSDVSALWANRRTLTDLQQIQASAQGLGLGL